MTPGETQWEINETDRHIGDLEREQAEYPGPSVAKKIAEMEQIKAKLQAQLPSR